MQKDIIPEVIFSPAILALTLAEGLQNLGVSVTLFTPGPVNVKVDNETADLSYFERELKLRGDNYLELLKKHPFTFVTLARQVQAELIAKAFEMANNDELDIIHMYTNEEDIALPFAKLCNKPIVFTHHDPFNFLVKYKNWFPKYASQNWLSISYAQRLGMPTKTRWVGNIYHGLPKNQFKANLSPSNNYIAYFGRIIEPKGVHLAIQAVQAYNSLNKKKLVLKIAGKHYSGHNKDNYWQEQVQPHLNSTTIQYVGFIDSQAAKQDFLGNAQALIVPSIFQEPFGMVMIEALACSTPVIGVASGAVPEVIKNGQTGILVAPSTNQANIVDSLTNSLKVFPNISRQMCRKEFEQRFTDERMCREHLVVYQKLTT